MVEGPSGLSSKPTRENRLIRKVCIRGHLISVSEWSLRLRLVVQRLVADLLGRLLIYRALIAIACSLLRSHCNLEGVEVQDLLLVLVEGRRNRAAAFTLLRIEC